jgi:tetratricopeptide (TPR) repeat protein
MRHPHFSLKASLWLMAVVAAFATSAAAIASDVQIGDRVVVITQQARLKVNAKVVAVAPRGQIYVVKQLKDDWYWVDWGDGLGWLKAQDAAPIERALTLFSEAIAENPTERNYKLRGGLRSTVGQFDGAIADFTEAIRINPDSFHAYGERAIARAGQRDLDGAIDDCNIVIRLTADNPWLVELGYFARSEIWAAAAKYDRAIADCEKMISLNPRQAGAYAMAAWILATCPDPQNRDGKKAVEYATQAVKLSRRASNPDRPAILAAAYAEAGDFAHAVEWQNKAISLALDKDRPDFTPALTLYESGKPSREDHFRSSDRPALYFESFVQ